MSNSYTRGILTYFCLTDGTRRGTYRLFRQNRRDTAASLHPAVFKKPKVSPSFEMAEKSDVLLQRKGHAMKDRIALLGIVISACQFSPSYLARASADQIGIASVYSVESGRRNRQRSRIKSRSSRRRPPHAAVGHEGDGNEQEQWAFGGRDHQRSRSLRAGADYRSVACGSSRSWVLGANARYGQRRIGPRELVIKSQDRRITQSGNSASLLLITDEVDRASRIGARAHHV